jgi:hypothetical protein
VDFHWFDRPIASRGLGPVDRLASSEYGRQRNNAILVCEKVNVEFLMAGQRSQLRASVWLWHRDRQPPVA